MTAPIGNPADAARDRAIESLLDNSRVRPSVIHRARRISDACDRLTKQSPPLTIPNVTDAARELYPDDDIATSTIWNKTASGDIYRGVVDAWKVWQFAKSQVKHSSPSAAVDADISDSILTRIQPREAQLIVLLMREALRNTKSQLNGLRSLTSERLIRPGGTANADGKISSTASLSRADLATIEAFVNEQELQLRGFRWGRDGELIAESSVSRSGPGVKDALSAALKCLRTSNGTPPEVA